jgi:hypothetical protein
LAYSPAADQTDMGNFAHGRMATARVSLVPVPPASVAVVVYPYVYASALESLFRSRGYDVTAPDIMVEEWEPTERYDVVVTTLPLAHEGEHIHVDLPQDYTEPVRISLGGIVVERVMDPDRPVEDLLDLIGGLVAGPIDLTADQLATLLDSHHRHRG